MTAVFLQCIYSNYTTRRIFLNSVRLESQLRLHVPQGELCKAQSLWTGVAQKSWTLPGGVNGISIYIYNIYIYILYI